MIIFFHKQTDAVVEERALYCRHGADRDFSTKRLVPL